MTVNGFRLYLRLGDTVTHRDHSEWREGKVEQEMTSTVPGGTCLVRVQWQDGRQRTFINDLDAQMCCYYFGVRKYYMLEQEALPPRTRRSAARRPLRLAATHGRVSTHRRQA